MEMKALEEEVETEARKASDCHMFCEDCKQAIVEAALKAFKKYLAELPRARVVRRRR